MLPQAYHNHHYNRKYHLTNKLPRQAPILRLSTNYLNSQNTNHDIMKVQPETLKYLTEVSIQGRKSFFMSLDPSLGLRSWRCLCIYSLIVVVSLVGFNAVINIGV